MDKSQAFDLWQKLNGMVWTPEIVKDIEDEWESSVLKLYKSLGGKRKSWKGAYTWLATNGHAEELKELQFPFSQRVMEAHSRFNEEKQEIENQLKEFAKGHLPDATECLTKLESRHGGDYHTQGFGANKYAKSALQEDAQLLAFLGYHSEIRESGGHNSGGMYSQYYADYELWANITEFDYAMIKLSTKFISTLNWAVMCWHNNTNPKVYFPFLSEDDYEKSQVLAYKSDYGVTRENMSLELSWEEINQIKYK